MVVAGSSASQPANNLVHVGIATVLREQQTVYRAPLAQEALGVLAPGDYVPHFQVTEDHGWLFVTMRDGGTGWLRNNPNNIRISLPDPTKMRVCLDPGHGGSERGAIANDLVESQVNLDIALQTRDLLAGAPQIEQIWLTRTTDVDVSLRYRWDLANASFASLFVSIHNNASEDRAIRGTETYFKCGQEGSDWLTANSARAACLIHQGMREQILAFGDPFCPWIDKGVVCRLVSREDPRSFYYVLQNTNVPSVLAECLYLTNPADALCLASAAFRSLLAEGIYQGIVSALLSDAPGACPTETLYGR